jgi:hypothetical protein
MFVIPMDFDILDSFISSILYEHGNVLYNKIKIFIAYDLHLS